MRNLAVIFVMLLAMPCLAGSMRPWSLDEPFVTVSLPREPVYVGTVSGLGFQRAAGRIEAHVVANCPHHIEASFGGFRAVEGGILIPPEKMSVAINGKGVPVSGGRVAIASSPKPTPAGGVDFGLDLEFGFENALSHPAGRYIGTLILTVMAGP